MPSMPPLPQSVPAVSVTVDARGLACPLPLLKAKLALNQLRPGECVRVLATDAGSRRDFAAFADIAGHRLCHTGESEGVYDYVLEKAPASAEG